MGSVVGAAVGSGATVGSGAGVTSTEVLGVGSEEGSLLTDGSGVGSMARVAGTAGVIAAAIAATTRNTPNRGPARWRSGDCGSRGFIDMVERGTLSTAYGDGGGEFTTLVFAIVPVGSWHCWQVPRLSILRSRLLYQVVTSVGGVPVVTDVGRLPSG